MALGILGGGTGNMGDYLRRHLASYQQSDVGFALFLGWTYCVLFGCGLATPAPELNGTPAVHALEHIWLFSGLAEGLGALAGVGLARRASSLTGDGRKTGCLSAMITGTVATALVWAAWLDRDVWFWRLCAPAGLFSGATVALLTMLWGATLGSRDEARIELAVPLSFAIAFVAYLVLLFLKPSALFNLAACTAMCVLSALLAMPGRDAQPSPVMPTGERRLCGRREHLGWRDVLPFTLQTLACWTQIAFFRVLATPELLGNARAHFFYPFLGACVVSVALFAVCLRTSRLLNVSLAYRWGLPLFAASYVPLVAGYHDASMRMLAYAVNFLGMFGVQLGSWMGAAKFVRRMRCRPGQVFARYALGEGVGVAAGCALGLVAGSLPDRAVAATASGLLTLTILAVMMFGFNPSGVFRRSKGLPDRTLVESEPSSGCGCPAVATSGRGCPRTTGKRTATPGEAPGDLEAIFRRQAEDLARRFGLTARETEVASLLLAGRTRPFIRDELLVALNTVNAHTRSIFSKCGVHSQQELIDLARREEIAG